MTAGNQAWWHAMVGAAQFEDGSLDIQDDSLDVNGGSTVNLLVKLGAKPRSDVTVALSEASALISLGVASLTFTPDNWDTFQSVTVTAAGNRQDLSLLADWYVEGQTAIQWTAPVNSRIPIISAFTPLNQNRFGVYVRATSLGEFNFQLASDQTEAISTGGDDLSDGFETNGRLSLSVGSEELLILMSDASTSTEPYLWQTTGSQSTDVQAFFNAVHPLTGDQAATLILRDYVPGDAAVSLSASGPSEYSGVTGSATVTVN